MYAFSFKPWSIHPVTTVNCAEIQGYIRSISNVESYLRKFAAKAAKTFWSRNLPNGQCLPPLEVCGVTRLMKMIRPSGTPCSFNTSTAFTALPPVAVGQSRCPMRTAIPQTHLAWGPGGAHSVTLYLEGAVMSVNYSSRYNSTRNPGL